MLNEAETPLPVDGLHEHVKTNDSWANDVKTAEARSSKIIRYAAITSFIINLCQSGAIVVLTPLKTVVPYMIVEDQHTGFWKVEKPLSKDNMTFSESRDKYLLRQYINYRESYSKDFYEDSYVALGFFSDQSEQERIAAIFALDNPNSAINVYKDKAHIKTFIKNISLLNKNVAQVRFSKLVFTGGETTPQVHNWVATVNYRYVDAEMSDEALTINPFGFQVTEYRLDPEAVDRR